MSSQHSAASRRHETGRKAGRQLSLAAALGLLLVPLWLSPAAANWRIEGLFLQELFYDDNVTLAEDDEVDSFGLRAQPGLRLSKEAPNSLLAIEAELTHTRFFSESDLDSTDQRGAVEYNRRGSRASYGLSAEFVRNTTRESELEDTGRIDRSVRRTSWAGGPSFTYLTGPLSRIETSASANRVTFGSDEFDDFINFAGQLAYIQSITPRDEVGLVFTASHFDSEDTENTEAENYSLSARWTRSPNDRFESTIDVGLRVTNSRFDEPDGRENETSVGFNLRGELDWQFDQGEISASILNAAEPSSDGSLRQRTRAQSTVRYRLTERLSALFVTIAERSEDIDAATDDDGERFFFSVSPSLSYRLTEQWRLTGQYRFRGQELDDSDLALSNAVLLTLTYNTIPFAF